MSEYYKRDSLSLFATVAMGTGVMIGAGIFALTGQVAELAGPMFPLAFFVAAVVSVFSAYSYIKVTHKYPSSGGIAMILEKAYGKGVMTGACALLMAISMVINESLVARTFGTYTLQVIDVDNQELFIPILAVGLIFFAFLVNIAGNRVISTISKLSAIIKIGGIMLFAIAAIYVSGFSFKPDTTNGGYETSFWGFWAAVALAILAYKGFTTITNSGDEVENPNTNIGRAIIISLGICLLVYMTVSFGVGSSLTIEEIIAARDYSLAEASSPVLGDNGIRFTVAIAIIATASGLLASIFAVSRMLAMLTRMEIIPHSHFGMPGDIQKHTLVYTAVLAALLAALFDLSRIASLGAIYYLLMDIGIHYGVFRHLRRDVGARASVLAGAIVLDVAVLTAFIVMKAQSDPNIIMIAMGSIMMIFLLEKYYLSKLRARESAS
ncbi:MAG: amino acid permease [marine bacterium B5-7]|nr:MAG: amino acid permease [marine bacterium B5-7]